MSRALDQALARPEGPERTAALAAWFQGLFRGNEPIPVLVGGAAVELYTGGAYTTGDLDFVGELNERVEGELEAAGFQRQGRHWIRREGEVFLEIPAASLGEGEEAAAVRLGDWTVKTVRPEDLIVDRLAAWQFWGSRLDATSAWLIYESQQTEIEEEYLCERAARREVSSALKRLQELAKGQGDYSPAELAAWAREVPE